MLRISDNRRYLVRDDGKPFFYLADTAWELFHRLNREEADRYLKDRARKGFTVVQAVVLAELDGLHSPNPYGHLPLQNDDPTRPVENYFLHVDWVVNRAARYGLFIGLLPTWGDKWNKKWGDGPEIFTPDNARVYGEFLGKRYRDKPVLWVLGGDRSIEQESHRLITRALALGLRQGDGGRHLISFHPTAILSSSRWFHDEPWLDFNMCQTGHTMNQACYDEIIKDWEREPAKPTLNAEPGYEHIGHNFWLENQEHPLMTDYDARKFLYWSVFAGACGHAYGSNEVWQMWQPGRKPIIDANLPWDQALDLPGAEQMRHIRRLLEVRPYLTRIPDHSLLLSDAGTGGDHVRATRDAGGSYALIYCPTPRPVQVRLSLLKGDAVKAAWFDPRTGKMSRSRVVNTSDGKEFVPPAAGPDWVLVLDAAK